MALTASLPKGCVYIVILTYRRVMKKNYLSKQKNILHASRECVWKLVLNELCLSSRLAHLAHYTDFFLLIHYV